MNSNHVAYGNLSTRLSLFIQNKQIQNVQNEIRIENLHSIDFIVCLSIAL